MQAYQPDSLPLENLDYKRLFVLIGEATTELARYDALLTSMVNPQIMLSPLTNEEAVLSSKIEGTQATVTEVLEQQAGIKQTPEKEKDIQEINNYRHALKNAHNYLQDRPITLSVVRQLHKVLMNSVRGQDKTPGEFRKDQNWIGSPGCNLEQASFIPPNPLQLLDYLEQWQTYLAHEDDNYLLQTAIMHAQFELLHPFKDGNGRVGRILIPLFLYQKKQLSAPMFYLSSYLESHREEYYHKLQNISAKGDWNGWIEFFFRAVTAQAIANNSKVKAIMRLYENMKQKIQEITHSQYSINILDAIFDDPLFKTPDFINKANINNPSTAKALLQKLKSHRIIREHSPSRGNRAAVLEFSELLHIIEGKIK